MYYKQILLNGENIFEKYRLVYQSDDFPSPDLDTQYVTVPYRSGDLDLTNAIVNFPVFRNVIGTVSFGLMVGHGDFEKMLEIIKNEYLGYPIELGFTDTQYIRKGRVVDVDWEETRGYMVFTLTINANPYRLKPTKTLVEQTLSGSTNIVLSNSGMPSTPSVTLNGEAIIKVGTNSYSYSAGTHTIPVTLVKGNNILEVVPITATTIKIEYQEGVI